MKKILQILSSLKPIEYTFIAIVVLVSGVFVYAAINPAPKVNPEDKVNTEIKQVRIYEFWGQGCPHCASANTFLDKYTQDRNDIIWQKYEVYYSTENQKLFKTVTDFFGDDQNQTGVPYIIIGDEVFRGYDSDELSGKQMTDRVEYCLENECKDSVAELVGLSPLNQNVKGETGIANTIDVADFKTLVDQYV
jgi:glutaredoxin